MKKLFFKTLAIAALFALTITGCNKEDKTVTEDNSMYEAQVLIDDVDNAYNQDNITEGDESTEFSASNEGLPEAYTIIETDMDDAGYKRANVKRLFVCLKKLDLSDTQVARIRKIVRAFELCKAYDIKMHREAYAKLVQRIEVQRKEYLAQLNNGKITKAQFIAKMKDLRADFEKSLRAIKASYAKNLKMCYDKFVRGLKEILTDRQWKAFVDCYR